MEVEAERQVAALRAELIAIAAGAPKTAPICPTCGTPMQRVGQRTRTVLTRGAVPVTLTGGRYRCSACGAELPPLAETLDLGSGTYSPWIVESAVLIGGEGPFRTAARLLTHVTGVAMSAATVRRASQAAGATMCQLELAFAETVRVTGAMPDLSPDVPLQLSIDGSLVHLRDEGWREVKLLAIGERPAGEAGLTQLTYAATLGRATVFGDEAVGELGRRGVPQATDVVTVNDGAVWIQEFVDLHCPQAQRVLDFAHAAGSLADAAKATWTDESIVAGWFATQRHELLTGDPDQVLAALAQLPASDQRDTSLSYLARRRDQIAYRAFTDQGWPIGSGCVERGQRHIVQDRLKGRGMRWDGAGATAMLAVRIVVANDRWDETWRQVGAAQRVVARARTVQRRAARQRPPAPSHTGGRRQTGCHPPVASLPPARLAPLPQPIPPLI